MIQIKHSASKEIERKFLIEGFPSNLELIGESSDRQGYVSVLPVVRIREKIYKDGKMTYMLCFKGDGDLLRTEIEIPIEKTAFEALEQLIGKPLISKQYRKYSYLNYALECSLVDEGTASEFYYAEIEFSSEAEANSFVAPPFLKEDVTYLAKYKMAEYWRATRLGD